MELHRVYCSHIQRVEIVPTSLHPDGAYILIDQSKQQLGSWTGQSCRNFDRLLAETLAAKIMQSELRKLTTDDSHIMANKVAPRAPPPFYLSAIQLTANEFIAATESMFQDIHIFNDSNRLFSVQIPADDSLDPVVSLLEEKHSDDSGNNPGKLTFSSFASNKTFILECGSAERYLWIGGRNTPKYIKKIKDFVKKTRGDFLYMRDRMESILFKEKFQNVADCFGRKSEVLISPLKEAALLPVESEVRRMVDGNFGTLSMLGDPGGPVGDNTRSGMLMSFADDDEGILQIYRVTVQGNSRSLEECFTDRLAPVVFSSSGAYAVQYICKNGSRAFVYLWVGNECPADVQAALALRCKEIFPAGVSPDQIHVQQGREPPLLLRVIFVKKNAPLCIMCSCSDIAVIANGVLEACLEISVTDVLLPNQAPIAREIPMPNLKNMSSRNGRIYMYLHCISDGKDSVKHTVKSVSGRILFGCGCSATVIDGARKLASVLSEISRAQYINCNDAAKIQLPVGLMATVTESVDNQSTVSLVPFTRPVRLFQVSQSRRSIGALFVEEIGSGGVFIRGDLSPHDCYILDSGCELIYVWLGARCTYPSLALATRVARKLVLAMQEAVVALSHRTDSNSVPYEPGQLHLDSYFKIDNTTTLKVEYIYGSEEPLEFTHFFSDWFVCSGRNEKVEKRCVAFDPESVDDDECKDTERDLEGRLLSDSANQKVKYSETAEYRRNSIIQQEKRNRRASSSESFTSVKLRSTPPPVDLVSRSAGSTPDSAAASANTPLTCPGMSPLNRRGSTGSSCHSGLKEHSGTDHFLQVKLKSTTVSPAVHESNIITHDVQSPPVIARDMFPIGSERTSGPDFQKSVVSDAVSPVKHMSLSPAAASKVDSNADQRSKPPASTPDSAAASANTPLTCPGMSPLNRRGSTGSSCHSGLKEHSGTCHFLQVKLKSTTVSPSVHESNTVPSAAPAGPTHSEPTATDAVVVDMGEESSQCDHRPLSTSAAGLDSVPKRFSPAADHRRASTGTYSPPKSFIPSTTGSEDFRQVKLKSSQRSIHQLVEAEAGGTVQPALTENGASDSGDNNDIPHISEAETQPPQTVTMEAPSSGHRAASSSPENDTNEKLDVPPAGCCVIM